MEGELRVLLAISDTAISQSLIDRFRTKHPNCPLIFDVVEDGQRALNEVRFFRPQVAVVDTNFPGLSGDSLAQGILNIYSECYIVLVARKNEGSTVGYPTIELPILSYDKALSEILKGMPIDFQIQYSLFERDANLLKKLDDYAKKYKTTEIKSDLVVRVWGGNHSESTEVEASQQPAVKQENRSGGELGIRHSRYEMFVILILSVLVGISWFVVEPEGVFGAVIKIVLLGSLVLCVTGFFSLRILFRSQKD